MKTNRVIPIFLLCGLILIAFQANRSELLEDSKVNDFKDLSPTISNEIKIDEFRSSEYLEKISNLSKTSEYHEDVGSKLYTVAQGSEFYSPKKLKILRMAKEHLLLAKRLKARHE